MFSESPCSAGFWRNVCDVIIFDPQVFTSARDCRVARWYPPGRGELHLALDVSANCTLNALVIR